MILVTTRAFIWQGMPGTIQFFDPFTESHVLEVNVVQRNVVSRTQKEIPTTNRVEHIALNKVRTLGIVPRAGLTIARCC